MKVLKTPTLIRNLTRKSIILLPRLLLSALQPNMIMALVVWWCEIYTIVYKTIALSLEVLTKQTNKIFPGHICLS